MVGRAGDVAELVAEAGDLGAELDSEARVVGLVRGQLVGGVVEGEEGVLDAAGELGRPREAAGGLGQPQPQPLPPASSLPHCAPHTLLHPLSPPPLTSLPR